MQVFRDPPQSEWKKLLTRPYKDNSQIMESTLSIIREVQINGDKALVDYAQKFDGIQGLKIEVSKEDILAAEGLISEELKSAIQQAKSNIEKFHRSQMREEAKVEILPGVICWRKSVGIEIAGLYIPGGSAPLFSTVLMLAIPAKLAGCQEIILCTPAGKDGTVHPAILYAASITGIHRVFATGGAQAIAAMAFGTETIPAVNKIFGPGNTYVTVAKQLVQMQGIAIDMPAGPSELLVLADDSANAAYVAADLLSQAEHGADSQVILVSSSDRLVENVLLEIKRQIKLLPREKTAAKAIDNSRAFIFQNLEDAVSLVNEYAAEHLIICCSNANEMANSIRNAGSVFIGNYSPESAGDYASGTNHTLPTNGSAKAYSGVSVESFVRKITFQELSRQGLESISDTIITMAMEEGLFAHANAVSIRKQKSND